MEYMAVKYMIYYDTYDILPTHSSQVQDYTHCIRMYMESETKWDIHRNHNLQE